MVFSAKCNNNNKKYIIKNYLKQIYKILFKRGVTFYMIQFQISDQNDTVGKKLTVMISFL